MNLQFIEKKFYFIFFGIVLCFVIFKIPHLYYPHFWDEAWTYSTTIQYLYDHNLNPLPGVIPPEMSRGHPLFYHELCALFITVFGNFLFTKHLFALLISAICLFAVACLLKKFNLTLTALTSTALIVAFGPFFVQSTFLLPEIALWGFVFVSLCAWIKKWNWLYIVSSTLAILTKEPALILILACFIYCLVDHFHFKNRLKLKEYLICFSPLFIVLPYFYYQYSIYGWWFFPEHMSNFNLTYSNVCSNASTLFHILFIGNYQFLIFGLFIFLISFLGFRIQEKKIKLAAIIFFVLSIAFVLFSTSLIPISFKLFFPKFIVFWVLFFLMLIISRKTLINNKEAFHVFFMLLIFNVVFFHFTILNFISDRYVMCIMLNNLVMMGILLNEIFLKNKKQGLLLITLGIGLSGATIFSRSKALDVTIAAYDAMDSHKQAVSFLESQKLYNAPMLAGFLFKTNLAQYSSGYRSNKIPFTNVKNYSEDTSFFEYIIIDNVNHVPENSINNRLTNFFIYKTFKVNEIQTLIYKKKSAEKFN